MAEPPEKANYNTNIMLSLCGGGFSAKSPDQSRYEQIKCINKKDSEMPNVMKLAVSALFLPQVTTSYCHARSAYTRHIPLSSPCALWL